MGVIKEVSESFRIYRNVLMEFVEQLPPIYYGEFRRHLIRQKFDWELKRFAVAHELYKETQQPVDRRQSKEDLDRMLDDKYYYPVVRELQKQQRKEEEQHFSDGFWKIMYFVGYAFGLFWVGVSARASDVKKIQKQLEELTGHPVGTQSETARDDGRDVKTQKTNGEATDKGDDRFAFPQGPSLTDQASLSASAHPTSQPTHVATPQAASTKGQPNTSLPAVPHGTTDVDDAFDPTLPHKLLLLVSILFIVHHTFTST